MIDNIWCTLWKTAGGRLKKGDLRLRAAIAAAAAAIISSPNTYGAAATSTAAVTYIGKTTFSHPSGDAEVEKSASIRPNPALVLRPT
jgi:hypothetical protein